jgi:hypothetical protein
MTTATATATKSTDNVNHLCDAFAREAHEENFESRRGTYLFTDSDLVMYYDNNPWAGDPDLRPKQQAEIKAAMAAAGFPAVAEGSYPKKGPRFGSKRSVNTPRGYTIAIAYAGGSDPSAAEKKLHEIIRDVLTRDMAAKAR